MKTRKLIILGVAIVACVMASCKKDEETPTNSVVFKANIESYREAGDDKTAIDTSTGRVVWLEDDQIRIHNGTTSHIFTLISAAGSTQGDFCFNGGYELTDNYLAAYPTTGQITFNSSTAQVVFNLPATQNLGEADSTFANGANPMVARATDINDLNFMNVCGGIGIRLRGAEEDITVSNIRISSKNSNDCLWGNLTVCIDDTDTTISIHNENLDTKYVIDLNCNFILSTTETKRVFIVLPEGPEEERTLSQGFTLEVTYKVGNGEYQNLSRTTNSDSNVAALAEVERNKLKSLPVLNIGSNVLPIVTTSDISNITSTSATCGGTVTSSGGAGATVTESGICWSTCHNPTISSSHASNDSGLETYTVSMTGLTPNTTYYVRAYAINSEGFIGYGEEESFNTKCTVSVSADPSDGGTVTGGGTYNQDASCTVTAMANEGYTFTNWTEDGNVVSTETTYTFTVNANRNLVANFTH